MNKLVTVTVKEMDKKALEGKYVLQVPSSAKVIHTQIVSDKCWCTYVEE